MAQARTAIDGGSDRLRMLAMAIGPGVVMAGAAVGGSHLVASTQAGANYGWALLVVLVLVNLFKYPFFLYGMRYTAATGETILHGYRRMGSVYLYAFFALTLVNAMLNIAGVALITASLSLYFGLGGLVDDRTMAVVVSMVCAGIIVFGRYRLLDRTSKLIMLLLSVSTLAAVVMALFEGPRGEAGFVGQSPWTLAAVGFLIQFMGWMPAPIDVAAWPSLWMAARDRDTGRRTSVRDAMIDFHLGYVGTVVLAVFFLALGALVMYGTGERFGTSGTQFSRDFIRMYSESIGSWAEPIVAVAAFTTMFSTTLACIDGWPRSLAMSTALVFGREDRLRRLHIGWILLTVAVGIAIVQLFISSLGQLLFLAMVVSFTTSPVFAWINYRVIRADWVPERHRPGPALVALSRVGLVFLTGSTLAFLVWLAW